MRVHCTLSSGGEITAGALPDAGYDIVVTVTDDAKGNTDEGKLTVTVTGESWVIWGHDEGILNGVDTLFGIPSSGLSSDGNTEQ